MGFFGRKKNKVYSLGEAMKLLQTSKYRDYQPVQVGKDDEYKFILVRKEQEEQYIPEIQVENNNNDGIISSQRADFVDRIRDEGTYSDNEEKKNYNN